MEIDEILNDDFVGALGSQKLGARLHLMLICHEHNEILNLSPPVLHFVHSYLTLY